MRFHVGVSFRWKTIKKFLLPILFGVLAYFGFGGIFGSFGFLNVFAYYNPDTTYTLDIPSENNYLQTYQCGNENVLDVVQNFIEYFDVSNAFANVEIYLGMASGSMGDENILSFYAWPKSYDMSPYFKVVGRNSGNNANIEITHGYNTFNSNNTFYYFEIKLNGCSPNSSNITSTSSYQNFVTFVNTGTFSTGSSNSVVSQFKKYDYHYSPYWNCFRPLLTGVQFTENDSYTIPINWIYYSSRPIILGVDSNLQASLYFKNIIINGVEYDVGDILPDVYSMERTPPPIEQNYIDYATKLNAFYTNLDPSFASSYNLTINFNVPTSILGYSQDPVEYKNNLSFDYVCSGRVDHTNYYTYETFPCSLTSTATTGDNSVSINFSNLSYTTSLSNYDKIYVTINSNYVDDTINKTIYQITTNFHGGEVYNTQYKGAIYENLDNLPLNFKIYLSSNNSLVSSSVYMFKYAQDYKIKIVGFSNRNNSQTLVVGHSILGTNNINLEANPDPYFSFFQVSNDIDTGILIYQDNSIIQVPRLELFFNSGIVLNVSSSGNDLFYYVDDTGTIVSDFFSPTYNNENNTAYDISYYVNKVNDFLDGLTTSNLIIANYTQEFYNDLNPTFQAILFVAFIEACLYTIYKTMYKE